MTKGSAKCKDYPTKQVKQVNLETRSSMADVGDHATDINRIRNQYAKEPPQTETDFMSAFMGKGSFG